MKVAGQKTASSLEAAYESRLPRSLLADIFSIAWWIAFGPHGPRAETPPGEWGRVWFYTAVGIAVSAVLFYGIHSFARPPPRTMTKEWQEATNEYLKVSLDGVIGEGALLTSSRKNESTPYTVSAAKVTKARVSCRASLQKLKVSRLSLRNNCTDYGSISWISPTRSRWRDKRLASCM